MKIILEYISMKKYNVVYRVIRSGRLISDYFRATSVEDAQLKFMAWRNKKNLDVILVSVNSLDKSRKR
jgi:hypothetical protein